MRIDDVEKAYEVRKTYCDYFNLEGYADGPHTDESGYLVDEFGREYKREYTISEYGYVIENEVVAK